MIWHVLIHNRLLQIKQLENYQFNVEDRKTCPYKYIVASLEQQMYNCMYM